MAERTDRRGPRQQDGGGGSTAVAVFKPGEALSTITVEYDKQADSIATMLPSTVEPSRFRELVLREVARDEKLLRCTPRSLIRAVTDMAKVGLEPVLGEAYLVPFWSNKASAYEATMILGYPGLQTLAYNSGLVTLIEGDVVYSNDEWTYVRGYPESVLRHVRAAGDRGEAIGAWAMVWLRDSPRPLMDFLPESRIEQARKVSRSGTDRESGNAIGVWRDWRDEMRLKTALRHVLKLAPRSIRSRIEAALDVEDAVDSMLRAQAVAAPALPANASRRARLAARAAGRLPAGDEAGADGGPDEPADEGVVRDDPEGADALERPETAGAGEPAPTSAPTGETAGRPETGASAAKSEGDVEREVGGNCGLADPYDGASRCYLAAGHPGGHRSDAASW